MQIVNPSWDESGESGIVNRKWDWNHGLMDEMKPAHYLMNAMEKKSYENNGDYN